MLRICILGNNKIHAEQILKYICQNDNDSKPLRIQRDRVLMDDDTEYYALAHSQNDIRGRYLDQLIMANDELRSTEVYDYAMCRLHMSCVPEEFKVQIFNI